MESIYCNGNQESKRLSESKPCELITDHDYYFLITPTQLIQPDANYINPINNRDNPSESIDSLLNNFQKVRKKAWHDETRQFSLTTNDTEFCINLAKRIPPIGQPAENSWTELAATFCKQFCFPGENQPKDSIIIGYWDEFEYFRHRANALTWFEAEEKNSHKSIADTRLHAFPNPGGDFSYNGNTNLEDALYPPFDISMAVRLNTKNVNNNSQTFLSGLQELQKQLNQETIAIFEIGQSIAQLHILNLVSTPPTHIEAAMRIYHLRHTAPKQTSNPHAAIIDSIVTGRCFAHQIPSTRPTSNCVVPYSTHTPPLINRAQAYHDHLSDAANRRKGIGGTWLPGGILAVAEGRWIWDIAFPFDNHLEEQNSLLNVINNQKLNVLSSQTSGYQLQIAPTPGNREKLPALCLGQTQPEDSWSRLLGGM